MRAVRKFIRRVGVDTIGACLLALSVNLLVLWFILQGWSEAETGLFIAIVSILALVLYERFSRPVELTKELLEKMCQDEGDDDETVF